MTTAIDLAREHAEALQQRDAVIDGLESWLGDSIVYAERKHEAALDESDALAASRLSGRLIALRMTLIHLRALKNGEATEGI